MRTDLPPQQNFRAGLRALPAHLLAIMAQPGAEQAAAIAGIQAYQAHPFRRAVPETETVWRDGAVQLLRFAGEKKRRGTVVIVPSLINSAAILDLLPDRSFARWLAALGFETLVLDWGRLADDREVARLDDVVAVRLLPALAFAAEREPVHGIGYCMGGTLLAAAAALRPETLRSLTFLASPWDFTAGDRRLADIVRAGAPAAAQIGAARGVLPADWTQTAFAALNADRTPAKFAAFSRLPPDDSRARLFVAVEDWLNEGEDLPAGIADDCIAHWYRENRPASRQWQIRGVPIDPSSLKLPALIVASDADRLVPFASAQALAAAIEGSTILTPPLGHIGMMSSARASDLVWAPVADWLAREF